LNQHSRPSNRRPAWLAALVIAPAVLFVAPVVRAQEAPPLPAPPAEAPPAEAPAAAAAPAAEAPAAPAAIPAELEARIADIDQRARIAERKLELIDEEAAKAKETAAVVSAGERGFNFKSADSQFIVKVRGTLHADGRQFLDDDALSQRDAFFLRRVRPTIEATFADWADVKFMPDFAGGVLQVIDAYADIRPWAWLKLRVGKFKGPISLERLQSASAILFPERAFTTQLAPNRDVGVMLHGLIAGGIITYELAVSNGVVDGSNTDGDINHAKDFSGRLFLQPLKTDPYNLFANFGVGFAASTGKQFDAVGNQATPPAPTAQLPTFRTTGLSGVTGAPGFFSYPTGIIARGRRTRLAPQGYYYYGPFGLLSEYVQSAQRVEKGGTRTTFTHRAWQVAGSVVLGGKPLYEGVTVTNPFNLKKGTLGALEIGARYHELRIDEEALALDAAGKVTWVDPTRAVKKAASIGGILNWHWNKNLKLSFAYENARFEGGATVAAGGDRKTEHVLSERVQIAF
jgi:phosphate-selective porin OprO/OprP